MKRISFIHAADLHLDSPMVGLKSLPAHIFSRIKESTLTALKQITAAAIQHQVDFVVFAGDLFDGEDRSLRAQSRFRTEMLKLAEKNIPVYIIYGNHDHLNGSWVHLDLPANVHLFRQDVETKILRTSHGSIVHLYGFSYPTRHVFERKIDEYKKVPGADFHIGILHGNESLGKDHDNYAPFTLNDLFEKDFEYWALGHIHKRMVLSENPPVVYPGNIQGRHKKESGVKGFYHVELMESNAQLNFIESSDIIWDQAMIDTQEAKSFYEIFQLCKTVMENCRKDKKGTLLSLVLTNVDLESSKEKRSLDSELLELLEEDEKDQEAFVWPVEITVSDLLEIDKKQLIEEGEFYKELFKTVEQYEDIDSPLSPLYEHNIGRKYINELTNDERDELIRQAEKLLLKMLSN